MRYPDQLDQELGDARSVDEVLQVLGKNPRVRGAIKQAINQAAEAEQFRINNPHVVGSAGPGSDRVMPEGEPQSGVFGSALHDNLREQLNEALAYESN